jgi:pimeloyl-ACP methyl ester carboxylesterase
MKGLIRAGAGPVSAFMALRRLALAPLVLVLLALPAAAHAKLSFSKCGRVECSSFTVPIDRSGAVPGTFTLQVERARGHGHGALVAVAGGPGDSSTALTRKMALRLKRALSSHDLYTFDQRGTGKSDPIHCASFERGDPIEQSVPACAAQLGPKRNSYTTLESVRDLEDLRKQIGVPKLALYGISYGTYVAQAYAALYPTHVESLVLDSPVAPSLNADPFSVKRFKALAGVLRSICAHGGCRGIVSGFQAKAYSLLSKLSTQPLDGTYYDQSGKPHDIQLSSLLVATAFPDLDLRPNLRAELPRAVAAALRGDAAPIARLVAGPAAGTPVGQTPFTNLTLNMVTRCEEVDHGFSRTASPAERIAEAQALLARTPASDFAPFTPQIAFAISEVPECAYWPMLPAPPTLPTGRLPAVPALILQGESDLRTSVASGREVAARLPHVRFLTIPFVGHDVLGTDDSNCSLRAVAAFYGGKRVKSCDHVSNSYPPRPVAPTRLADVRPAAGIAGIAGRVLAAVQLTVRDGFEQADPGIFAYDGLTAAGGLRGGSYRLRSRGLELERNVFVPGVAVSGLVPRRGAARLTVSGTLSGTLTFSHNGGVTGRLGGHALSGHAPLVRETAGQRLARPRALRFP